MRSPKGGDQRQESFAGGVRAQETRRINSEPMGWLAPCLQAQEDVSKSASMGCSAVGLLLAHTHLPVGCSFDVLPGDNMDQGEQFSMDFDNTLATRILELLDLFQTLPSKTISTCRAR